MTEPVQHFTCPLCRGTFSELAFHFDQGDYRRCTSCGLLSLHPMPSAAALMELYDDAYYGQVEEAETSNRQSEVRCVQESAGPTDRQSSEPIQQTEGYHCYRQQQASRTRTFRRYAAAIAKERPNARVLDVGCALGFFLDAALEYGLDVHGIDASEAAIAKIRSRFGARVRSGTLADMPAEEAASFDVVFASDLIEHIPDPHALVAQLARLLKPGGQLVAITPNAESLLARVSGQRWVSLKPPEHVALYTPKQIRQLLGRNFSSVEVTTALQDYPASLVAERLGALWMPARALAERASSLLGARQVRVPDGNMLVRARLS